GVEARAVEPIVPLELFRNRSFTISVIAMFMASMAFFAPVVFLPRWFQVVGGASATQSGYQILALLGGLIVSAILSGQLVARTGRYKPLALGSPVLLAIGLFLLSNLRADTPLPLLWLWMFVTGVGVGPIFAIFTLVVQNAVAPRQIGTATSSLTLFQQVGGSVGLAAAGTVFGSRLLEELPRQVAASPVPRPGRRAIGGSRASQNTYRRWPKRGSDAQGLASLCRDGGHLGRALPPHQDRGRGAEPVHARPHAHPRRSGFARAAGRTSRRFPR